VSLRVAVQPRLERLADEVAVGLHVIVARRSGLHALPLVRTHQRSGSFVEFDAVNELVLSAARADDGARGGAVLG